MATRILSSHIFKSIRLGYSVRAPLGMHRAEIYFSHQNNVID